MILSITNVFTTHTKHTLITHYKYNPTCNNDYNDKQKSF